MMPRLSALIVIASLALATLAPAALPPLEVINNHTFAIREPLLVRGLKLGEPSTVAQQVGDDAIVMVEVPASASVKPLEKQRSPAWGDEPSAEAAENGIAIKFGDKDLGKLAWDIVYEKLPKKKRATAPSTAATSRASDAADKDAAGNKRDFDKLFKPLPLTFKKTSEGGLLFETWSAVATREGMKLAVVVDVYRDGFVDIHQTFTNESAARDNVYCAVVRRWTQPGGAAPQGAQAPGIARSCDYDNHIIQLDNDTRATPFRAGEGRHLFIQRGVDWIVSRFPGVAVAWLNDFTPGFTFHRDATAKTPARWVGANTAQLGEEAIINGDKLYSITEIARPNIRSYQARLEDNVLPGPDQPLRINHHLVFKLGDMGDEAADQAFVAYTSFRSQEASGDPASTRVTLGVPFVKFGTAYFPYSTLGENFEKYHMPGQSKESYWPLSADTVTNYKLFADDIRGDLRIAKTMGFQSIRLHHLELIDTLPKNVQDEYLDFLFGELKHVGLTALMDVKLKPDRLAELVKKYRPLIDGVEIDNEVLIFGVDDAAIDYWKDCYKTVKSIAPEIPVWWTAHTNTGAFERIRQLGVPFDKVGSHAYMDSVDAIPSSRDYALAVSDYASSINKPPTITEWNWRFLTRMTDKARAEVYPPIFENVLAARAIPLMYQFQFQESLAMASKTLRGIRHYELLNLSRRPRPEAMEFMKLIGKYGDPNSPQRVLETNYQSVTMQDVMKGSATIMVGVTNKSDRPCSGTATAEGPQGVELSIVGDGKFAIEPNQTAAADLKVKLPADAQPGFYHLFVRFETDDHKLVSYAWIELRNPGKPKIDTGDNGGVHPEVSHADGWTNFNFNRDISIVYGKEASGWEVESAWLIYQTLESATGRPVKIFQLDDLPPDVRDRGTLIIVGTPKTNPLIKDFAQVINPKDKAWVATGKSAKSAGQALYVAGADEASVNLAAIDLVLRYWKYAKDSGMRRVPLTDKPIEKGPDPGALP